MIFCLYLQKAMMVWECLTGFITGKNVPHPLSSIFIASYQYVSFYLCLSY